MVWNKNPGYWDEGKPYLDSIRWLILPDEATQQAAFQVKQVDLLTNLFYRDFQQVSGANPNASVQQFLQPRAYKLYLGRTWPGGGVMNDIRVRRAVALAIDRDGINKAVAGGRGVWSVPGVMGAFTEAEARQMEKYDPEESKRLLAEAGYPNGLKLDWPFPVPNPRQDVHELVQAMLKRVGVDAPFRTMDQVTQRPLKYSGNYDLDEGGGGTGQAVGDVDSLLYGAYHSSSPLNWAQLRDPELDRLVEAQRRELDPGKRRELFRAVGKRIVDMTWAIYLIHPPQWSVSHGYVKNFYSHFGNNFTGDMEKVWLDK